MRIQTEYMSLKYCWMISSSYDFQGHQQCSERRFISPAALQWFEMIPAMLPALRSAHRLADGASRLVVGTPRCSPGCQQITSIHPDFSLVLSGVPEGHCIGLLNSGIWPSWDSGSTTPRHCQRLPLPKIHFCNELLKRIPISCLCQQVGMVILYIAITEDKYHQQVIAREYFSWRIEAQSRKHSSLLMIPDTFYE